MNLIENWKNKLGLNDWGITTERVQPDQVEYNGEVEFIGVYYDRKNSTSKKAIIYHDVDLYEEAIVHELLHLKYPDKNEDWINVKTKEELKNK